VSNLTRNQLQVWVAHNLLPEVPIYNLAVGLHLDGAIDPDHFARAFRVLVDPSDALRAVVEEHDGIPMQRVLPQAPMPLDFLDLSQHPEAEMRTRTWMASRCETPVDWRHALYDSTLIKIGQMHFVWYLNIHHMICGGWSIELIYRRLAELYRASLEGSLPDRDDLPAFADYRMKAYRQSSRHQRLRPAGAKCWRSPARS
jgi:hypothetical protein